MLVTRIGGDRVSWDHDGRVFGASLGDFNNVDGLDPYDAVLLLADDDLWVSSCQFSR